MKLQLWYCGEIICGSSAHDETKMYLSLVDFNLILILLTIKQRLGLHLTRTITTEYNKLTDRN